VVPLRQLSLDHFHLPKGRRYHIYRISGSEISQQPHCHDYYQICYVECGQVEHRQEHNTVFLEAGDAFIVPPGFVHQILFPDPGAYLYSLSFGEDLFHAGFSQSNVYHFMTALKLESLESQRIPIRLKLKMDFPRQQTLKALMDALIREQDSTCPKELSAAGSLVAAILCVFSQGYFLGDRQQLQDVTRYTHSLEQCLRYIDAHFTEDLSLEDTARRFALSRSQFSLLFPQHTGLTFKRYLSKKRIGYAITLLQTTDLPIQQIAAMAGYEDASTFYRNFTKVTGHAPSDYRTDRDLEARLYLNTDRPF